MRMVAFWNASYVVDFVLQHASQHLAVTVNLNQICCFFSVFAFITIPHLGIVGYGVCSRYCAH